MLECNLHLHTISYPFTINNIVIQWSGALIQILNKFLNTALIMIDFGTHRILTLICQRDLQSLCQKCHLAQSGLQSLEIILCHFKHGLIRQEAYRCTSLAWQTGSNYFQRIAHFSSLISLTIDLTFTVNCNFQPVRQCIYNRCPNAMKSSGYFVSSTAEFSSRMKNSKYHLNCRFSSFMVDACRNSTSIIFHSDRIIHVDRDLDMSAISSQCLINGIIYDLIHQMVQSPEGSIINIHTRSFSDRLKSFQYLNLICSVFCTHLSASCLFSTVTLPSVTL